MIYRRDLSQKIYPIYEEDVGKRKFRVRRASRSHFELRHWLVNQPVPFVITREAIDVAMKEDQRS